LSFLLVILCFLQTGCNAEAKTPLRVFIAGSLMVPFDELEQAYETLHPEVDVQIEAHGSVQVIRHVTELHDQIDVVVPADYALIPMLMYQNPVPKSGQAYADWYIRFASNQVVLAYTSESHGADEVNAENWHAFISQQDVRFGLSDPRLDAAGYRSLMIVQLAEKYFLDPTIFERVFLGRFKEQLHVEKSGGQQIIYVPELLDTRPDSNIVLRGGSVALLALLESGDIDYAFEYESVARQHGLNYVELPPEINLSEQSQVENYASVRVRMDYQRFSTVKPEFQGEVIGYGITIPSNAPHPELAQEFITFLLGPQGAAIMEANNHPVFSAPQVDNCAALPEKLKRYCEK
jgi:molybdate/tungstate transport system substrate-binding protein